MYWSHGERRQLIQTFRLLSSRGRVGGKRARPESPPARGPHVPFPGFGNVLLPRNVAQEFAPCTICGTCKNPCSQMDGLSTGECFESRVLRVVTLEKYGLHSCNCPQRFLSSHMGLADVALLKILPF